jgi:hypothetical protein
MKFESRVMRFVPYKTTVHQAYQIRGNLGFEVTVKGNIRRHIRSLLFTIKTRVENQEGSEAWISIREDKSLNSSTFYVHSCRVTVAQARAIKDVAEKIFTALRTPAYFHPKGIIPV